MKMLRVFLHKFIKLGIIWIVVSVFVLILCTLTAYSSNEQKASYEIRINLWHQDLQLLEGGKAIKTFKVAPLSTLEYLHHVNRKQSRRSKWLPVPEIHLPP
ncbi:hypothetical protein [Aneurinibacillus thermoaerophilus]|uniref:hypothetical protein n=1 Tax=Aneurinibacillus thermoaerophilus TaxID=143495 RepID=UPI002E1D8C0E|nr:hypothetical protein [Aneurinibacillus thermoaerophilus]